MVDENESRIQVYRGDTRTCSYLPDRQSQSIFFFVDELDPAHYEALLAQNWRRSGRCIYRPQCSSCSLCMQFRVDVRAFVESKSQRLCLRRNEDLHLDVSETLDATEALELYSRYQLGWHMAETAPDIDETRDFLGSSPLDTIVMNYRLGERLVGAGWVDVLENGLSSVYFAFDPAEASRRLGVFSLLQEIRLARSLHKDWLYLGYWVPGSRTMNYKADYRPHEVLINGNWERDKRATL